MKENQIGMDEITTNSYGESLRLLIKKRTQRYKSLVKKERKSEK